MRAPTPIAPPQPAEQVLYVKHVVCPRCLRVLQGELQRLGLRVLAVRLGAATVAVPPGGLDWPGLRRTLTAAGFALLENPARDLAGCVQAKVAELLRREPAPRHRTFAARLAQELGLSPGRLRAGFARLGRGSLAAYVAAERLAYAQELLRSSALDVGRIARQLGYGSLAHFSGQFRQAFARSPSSYRQQASHPAATAETK